MKALALVVFSAVLLIACGGSLDPAKQASDFAAAYDCVRSNWGQPIEQVASACFNNVLTAAEDAVADVEAILEGTAILSDQDLTVVVQKFPYASDGRITQAVESKRALFLAQHGQ